MVVATAFPIALKLTDKTPVFKKIIQKLAKKFYTCKYINKFLKNILVYLIPTNVFLF